VSLATRALVAAYRKRPSRRPDGGVNVRDGGRIVHAMTARKGGWRTACGRAAVFDDDFGGTMASQDHRAHGASPLRPTWDDVDCMYCVEAGVR
jgi:hypothetical protein